MTLFRLRTIHGPTRFNGWRSAVVLRLLWFVVCVGVGQDDEVGGWLPRFRAGGTPRGNRRVQVSWGPVVVVAGMPG